MFFVWFYSALCGDFGCGFADEEKNKIYVEKSKRVLDLSIELGCKIVTTHIGTVPEEENEKKEEEGYQYTKYTNDDGNIVAVTYGDNGVAYRTFILNYNFFEVTVNYNGNDYTVPAFGYVIIEN